MLRAWTVLLASPALRDALVEDKEETDEEPTGVEQARRLALEASYRANRERSLEVSTGWLPLKEEAASQLEM